MASGKLALFTTGWIVGEKKTIHEGNDLMNQRVAEKGCAPSFFIRITHTELLSMNQDQRWREVE